MYLYPFVLVLLAIVLSVLLRFTDSDYPFGIFKLFFLQYISAQDFRCKQWSTKHYTENLILSKTNPSNIRNMITHLMPLHPLVNRYKFRF